MNVETIEFVGEGDFCQAFLLNGDRIIRAPKHVRAERALEREACLLPLIAPHLPLTVPVPVIFPSGSETDDVRIRFSMHTRVPGRELAPDEWDTMPPAMSSRLARQLGEFFQALHGLPVMDAVACGVDVLNHHDDALRLHREFRTCDLPLPAMLEKRIDVLLAGFIENGSQWEYQAALLNGDVSPEHVLVNDETAEIAGIIDWGDLCIGDPARDFIFLYEDWNDAFLRDALNAYAPGQPDSFLRRVHWHYLMNELDWTLAAAREERQDDVAYAVIALDDVVRQLEGGLHA